MTENQILPENLHGQALIDFMEAHADATREDFYTRPLTPDEIIEHKSLYVEAGLEKQTLEEEMSEIRKEHKQKHDSIKQRFKHHGKCIKTKSIEQKGIIYLFKDFENGRVYEYTEYGQLISDRRMNPEDRQRTVKFPNVVNG